jgi:hypothetical protein
VERTFTNAPAVSTRSLRVLPIQDETDWGAYAGSGVASTSVTQEIVAHTGAFPAAFSNENPGASCLKLSCAQSGEFGIWHYRTGGTGDTWWGVNQFPTGKTYRMECWVKGQGMVSNTVRFSFGSYVDRTVTGLVNGAWTRLAADFAVTNWVPGNPSVFGPYFRFRGPGTVYVDNAVVYGVEEPRGPARLSAAIYDGLWREYVGPTNQTRKGALRTRYLSPPLRHVLSPPAMSHREWSIDYGANSSDPLHACDSLQASYESGADPETRTIPWITVNLNWTEQNFLDLVEYLAGPTNTPYGALRQAERGGIAQPWTDEFRAIYLEMGNEPWNAGYFFVFRGGFTDRSGQTYGRWCQYMGSYMATNSPYWAAAGGKIKILLGGWAASLSNVGFSSQAVKNCPLAYGIGFTTYLGGWEANDPVGGTVWSDEGVQQWLVYKDRSGQAYIDNVRTFQASMEAQGFPVRVTMYEGGPSYLMNGLNGVSLTAQEQEVSRNYGRTLAAGVGTLDFWLYGTYRGVKEQEYFTSSQDQGLWCSHTPVYTDYRPHPAWQALQLFNRRSSFATVMAATVRSVPTYDMLNTNGTVRKANVPLASCYAFRDGDRFSVFVLNKKLDGVHDGRDFSNGHVSATIVLPFTNTTAIALYKLSGDPRLTNRNGMNIQVVSQAVSVASFSTNFAINAATGGEADGMPQGVFLYVFEGCVLPPPPAPPPSLQSLFDAAGPGGTVTIPSGVYSQNVTTAYAVTVTGGTFTLSGTMTLADGAGLTLLPDATFATLRVTGAATVSGDATAGNLQIDPGATLTVANGRLVANGVTLTGTFTLDENWGTALIPQPLPFADDFELYGAGQPVNGLGYFGWTATNQDATVEDTVAQHGVQGVFLPCGSAVDGHVDTAALRLWTDLRVQPPLGLQPTDAPAADESVRISFTDTGFVAIAATNGGWDVCASDAFHNAVSPLASGVWARVTLHHDFERRRVAVFLNGRLLRDAAPVLRQAATGYHVFTCRNGGGSAQPHGYIDRVSVATEIPHDLDDLTDGDADGDRGYDGDADGMADAVEIHRYSDLSTFHGQPFGTALMLR